MIKPETSDLYFETFGTYICRDEAGGQVFYVEDDDGNAYNLSDLTDGEIVDKIKRSKELGMNLFYIECPAWNPQYEDGAEY